MDVEQRAMIVGDVALLPCPFCGAKDPRYSGVKDAMLSVLYVESRGPGWAAHWHVDCDGCATQGLPGATKDEAIKRWNTRPTDAGDLAERLLTEKQVYAIGKQVADRCAYKDKSANHTRVWLAAQCGAREADKVIRANHLRATDATAGVVDKAVVARVFESLRDPTPAMLDAFVARALQVSIHDEGGWTNYARNQWQTMLDAALRHD